MTLEEIKASEKQYLTPSDVCGVLHCKPYTLNKDVKSGKALPFPHFMIGRWLRIPRITFIKFCEEHGLS